MRAFPFALILLLASAPGPAGADEKRPWSPVECKPVKPVERGDLRSPTLLGREHVSDVGLVSEVVQAVAIPVGKQRALLLDLDRDGAFGSAGDAYVAPESKTAGPWTGEVWHAGGAFRIRADGKGGHERAPLALPHPTNKDHCRAWCLLQWRRQQCGVPPLGYDRSLEDGMIKHAKYLGRNGGPAHAEDPKLSGYTPEGARAAQNCIIGQGDSSAYAAMQMHLATLYHRTRPLQPGLTHTAMVVHDDVFLLNVFARRGGPLKDALLVYPAHGMENVALRFHPQGEHPMPVAEVKGDGNTLGTAISIFSEPLRLAQSLRQAPTVEVKRKRRKAKMLEGHFHYPGLAPSARVGVNNRGCVALVPRGPLRAKTSYLATARVPLPGGGTLAYVWSFTTAKAAKRR